MSKKHFRALADAIASIADKAERERVCDLVGAVCAGCNGRFCWHTWRAGLWGLTNLLGGSTMLATEKTILGDFDN